MDVLGGFLAAGNVEIAAARCAAADEDRVIILGEQSFQAVDAFAADKFDAEIEDVLAFLVEHGFRQAEFRNLRAHHTAGLRILIHDDAVVAHRREIARHRQRSRTAADQCDALAVFLRRRFGQPVTDVILEIGGDALEPADRDRFLLDPAATAGRFAGPVAGAPENPRKHIGVPVDHIGVAITPGGDQADIFRNGGVGWTGPLAVHHFVEVVRDRNVGELHQFLVPAAFRSCRAVRITTAWLYLPWAVRSPNPGGY